MRYLMIALLFMLAGCGPQITVHTDYDPDYDLWVYKTFDWGQKVNIEEGKNPLHYNELNDKRIKAAVKHQLTKRGYTLTSDNPDLILHYHITVEDQTAIVTEPFGYSYGPYWTRMNSNVFRYREGTLILDLMEKKTSNLVWRGWAVTDVKESYTPQEVEKTINQVVTKIFKKFPRTKTQVHSPRK